MSNQTATSMVSATAYIPSPLDRSATASLKALKTSPPTATHTHDGVAAGPASTDQGRTDANFFKGAMTAIRNVWPGRRARHDFKGDNLAPPAAEPGRIPDLPHPPDRVDYRPLEIELVPQFLELVSDFNIIRDSIDVSQLESGGLRKNYQTSPKLRVIYELDIDAIVTNACLKLRDQPLLFDSKAARTKPVFREMCHPYAIFAQRNKLRSLAHTRKAERRYAHETFVAFGTLPKALEDDILVPVHEEARLPDVTESTVAIVSQRGLDNALLDEIKECREYPEFVDSNIDAYLSQCNRLQDNEHVILRADDGGDSVISRIVSSDCRPYEPGRPVDHDAIDIEVMSERLDERVKVLGLRRPEWLQDILDEPQDKIHRTRALHGKWNFAVEFLVNQWHKYMHDPAEKIKRKEDVKALHALCAKDQTPECLPRLRRLEKHKPGAAKPSGVRPYMFESEEEYLNQDSTDYTSSQEQDLTPPGSRVSKLRRSTRHTKLEEHHRIAKWVCDMDEVDFVDANAYDGCSCNHRAAKGVRDYREEAEYNLAMSKDYLMFPLVHTYQMDLINDQKLHRCHEELPDDYTSSLYPTVKTEEEWQALLTEQWQVLEYDGWDISPEDEEVVASGVSTIVFVDDNDELDCDSNRDLKSDSELDDQRVSLTDHHTGIFIDVPWKEYLYNAEVPQNQSTCEEFYPGWLLDMRKEHDFPVFIDYDLKIYQHEQHALNVDQHPLYKGPMSAGPSEVWPTLPGRPVYHNILDMDYMFEIMKGKLMPGVIEHLYDLGLDEVYRARDSKKHDNIVREELIDMWHALKRHNFKDIRKEIQAAEWERIRRRRPECPLNERRQYQRVPEAEFQACSADWERYVSQKGPHSDFRAYLTDLEEFRLNMEGWTYRWVDAVDYHFKNHPYVQPQKDANRVKNWVLSLDPPSMVGPNLYDDCDCGQLAAIAVGGCRAEKEPDWKKMSRLYELFPARFNKKAELWGRMANRHLEVFDGWWPKDNEMPCCNPVLQDCRLHETWSDNLYVLMDTTVYEANKCVRFYNCELPVPGCPGRYDCTLYPDNFQTIPGDKFDGLKPRCNCCGDMIYEWTGQCVNCTMRTLPGFPETIIGCDVVVLLCSLVRDSCYKCYQPWNVLGHCLNCMTTWQDFPGFIKTAMA